MRNHRQFTAFAAALALGLLLSAVGGCAPAGQPTKPEEKAAPAKEKPQYGGTHTYVIPNPRIGQDPHRTTGSSHFETFGRSYSSLLRNKIAPEIPNSSFIVAPDLAERWENPTPNTWTFYLRKGVKWHNVPPVSGREFVADDVVYSVNRLAGKGSAQAGYWQDLEKVEALDKYTVKFTLNAPTAPFLSILALGYNKMVAKEAVEAGGGNLDNGPLIGTGPWFVTCTVDVECVFKPNPEFHLKDEDGNRLPYLGTIRGVVMPDVQAVFAAFRAKQIDTYGLTAEERQIVERSHPEVIIKEVKGYGSSLVHFRIDKAPWNDERVRTAVSKAINRQEIIDTVFGGKSHFAANWASPGEDWVLSEEEFEKAYKQDIEGAKKLLAEAGYPNGFDASFWVATYGAYDVPTAELIASYLAKVGIRIKLKIIDRPGYLSSCFIRHGTYEDMCGFAGGAPPEPDLWLTAYYHSQGARNASYVNDPKLDQMVEAQRQELNPQKRKQIILDTQRYIIQKNYGLWIQSTISQNAWWPWLKNWSFTQDYPGYLRVDNIWVDQELRKKMGAPQ